MKPITYDAWNVELYADAWNVELYAVEIQLDNGDWMIFKVGEKDQLEELDEIAKRLATVGNPPFWTKPSSRTRVVRFEIKETVKEYKRRSRIT